MKKKLFRVLLVLSLCTALAIPAFAEPAEEPPAPEETTPLEVATPEGGEILNGEETHDLIDPATENGESWWSRVLPSSDLAGENEGPEGMGETVFVYGHFHCIEEVVEEDGTIWLYGYQCSDALCPYLQYSQTTIDELSVTRDGIPGTCLECGRYNWGPKKFEGMAYDDVENSTTHKERELYRYSCQTAGCGGWGIEASPWRTVAHSWSKGGLESCQSVDGSTHKATYNYSCKCGATKTESETESHSLSKYDFGSNYHKGKLHYVEWIWRCSDCGYTVRRWESQSCPGNDNGEGCIFGINKIDPPVEVQDVTGPEEAT